MSTSQRATIALLLSHDALLDLLTAVGSDYALTHEATASLPRTTRRSALQKRRGAYLRALRQTLRTVELLMEDEAG